MTLAPKPDQNAIHTMVAEAEAHLASGRLDSAASLYEKVIPAIAPNADLHHVLGLVYHEQGRFEKALGQLYEAAKLAPGKPNLLRALADAQQAAGDLTAAADNYQKALDSDPDNPQVLLNLGNAWHAMDHLDQALNCYQKVSELDPGNKQALSNLGKTYLDLNCLDHAMVCLNQSLEIDPNYAEARFNRAVALLTAGDYGRGWQEYEWRFKRKSAGRVYPHKLTSPRWQGQPFPGKCLLVHAEQGMGDVLQFVRYLPWVKHLGGTVILEAHSPLLPLLRAMECIDMLIPFDQSKATQIEHDLHIPLLSIPALFGATSSAIPAQVPYLQPDEGKLAQWRKRLTGSGLHVGLVWSGSSLNPRRHIALENCRQWFDHPGISFTGLQKGAVSGKLTASMADLPFSNVGDQLSDFSDTAAAIACLDLVISVDTAAAHLAGALAKPAWVLLPFSADWRWPPGLAASPWYPTVKTFRQPSRGDWSAVITQIDQELYRFTRSSQSLPPLYSVDADPRLPAGPVVPDVRYAVETSQQLLNDGKTEEAKALLQNVVKHRPADPVACYNLGLACQKLNDLESAVRYYCQSLEAAPDFSRALSNLGTVRLIQGQIEAAVDCFENVARMEPHNTSSHYNLGNAYLARNEPRNAIESYRKALSLNPHHYKSLNNMGQAWHQLGEYDRSRACLDQAVELQPEYAEAHLNRAVNALLLGDWAFGWQEYEWRFKCHNRHRVYPHRLVAPLWDGRPLAGQSILVHSEQGIGDALQFCRYIPLIKARGGHIIFEVRESLYPLLKTFKGADECVTLSDRHPYEGDYDWHLPLGHCPLIFGTSPDNVPSQTPYILGDPSKIMQWHRRLPADGYRVGLVWSGNDTYRQRSCRLDDLAVLAKVEGVNWIGLQKGPAAAMADPASRPVGFKVDNLGDDFHDFSDTAAVVASLDLVISIDTSVAHLAGAMGKPVWVMLPSVPDWRWMLQREDSPWYPGMRLFRQQAAGQWQPVIHQIANGLEQFLSQLA